MHKIKFDKKDRVNMAYTLDNDETIYICNSLNKWGFYEMIEDIKDVAVCVLSHESIHIALDHIGQVKASHELDNKFGSCRDHKNVLHGLCKFDKHFKPTPKHRRLRGW